MSESRRKKNAAADCVRKLDDDRVSCYHRENYDLRNLKSRSLAWLVQIAVRHDLIMSGKGVLESHNPRVMLQGHLEIFFKADELFALIRRKHLIDETDLASIGLTLYNFPTLSHFFVATREHKFVREATVRELREDVDFVHTLVLNSRLAAYLPEGQGRERDDRIYSLVDRMIAASRCGAV
jgi:hypothetical protein